jgi:hypothetical protein
VYVDDVRLQYARLVADLVKTRLVPHLAQMDAAGCLPLHLQRVQLLLGDVKDMRNVSTASAEALLEGSGHVLARICSDILHPNAIDKTLKVGLLFLHFETMVRMTVCFDCCHPGHYSRQSCNGQDLKRWARSGQFSQTGTSFSLLYEKAV